MSWIGCVDVISDTCIAGWAADDADLSCTIQVEILVNAEVVATLSCATFREDLRAAGIGDGCKAFEFDPCSHLKPGRNTLEIRFAGTAVTVPKGRGHWVKLREGVEPDSAGFIAAIEAYHEFQPNQHVHLAGPGANELGRAFRQARIPFGKLTSGEAAAFTEPADVSICWDWPAPSAKTVHFLLDNTNALGLFVAGFDEAHGQLPDMRNATFESIASRKLPGVFAFTKLGASPAQPCSVPVLAHIHVPKCAGTSLRVLLESYFGPRYLRLYVNDTYFVYGDEAVRNYLLRNPELRGYSSHHVRSFPRWVAGREMLYVTFLRDPIEQFVSYMTHIKKHYPTITAKTLLEAVPPDAPHLSLREFARWLLTQERDIPFRENHNVNFFARHNSPDNTNRLQAAKAALERFFFVGITERMAESMNQLRAKAAAAGLDFPSGPEPFENTSSDYRDDLSWIHPGDEVGALLLRSVELDRQLYQWALARLSD